MRVAMACRACLRLSLLRECARAKRAVFICLRLFPPREGVWLPLAAAAVLLARRSCFRTCGERGAACVCAAQSRRLPAMLIFSAVIPTVQRRYIMPYAR